MKYFLKFALYLAVAVGFSTAKADAYVDFFRAVNIDDARTVNQLLARGFDPNSPQHPRPSRHWCRPCATSRRR